MTPIPDPPRPELADLPTGVAPLSAEEAATVRLIRAVLDGPAAYAAEADGAAPPAALTGIVITPATPRPARVRLSQALPLSQGELAGLLADPCWGVTEQVSGQRCVIVGEE